MDPELTKVRMRPGVQHTLLAELRSSIWAIEPERLRAFAAHVAEGTLPEAAGREQQKRVMAGAVAVLPLVGEIFPKENIWTYFGFGTAASSFARQLREALNDDAVGAVLIDVDSPGGLVAGTPELADAIFSMRGSKPIVATADYLMASAAYWIASAADEIVAAPTAIVGSIGVISMHSDYSRMLEQFGLDITLITAGEHKAEANPFQPLSEDDRSAVQARVDEYYAMFTRAVGKHRGVSPADVRNGYGEGRVLTATAAKAAGMVDRIETLEQTLARLARGGGSTTGRGKASVGGVPPAEMVALSDECDLDLRTRRTRLAAL